MFKRFKKIVSTILIVAIAMTTFAGCSSKPSSENQQAEVTPTSTSTTTPAVKEKPKGTITVWGWDYIKKCVDVNMEAFKKEYPDINIEFQVIPAGDLYKKFLLGASAGGEGLPDVAAIETSNLAQMIETEGLMDLTEQTKPYLDKINEFKWAEAQKDGKVYAMPWDSGPVVLYYRRDVFEKAGLPSEPEKVAELLNTWDDYYNVAKTIKEKTGVFMFAESKEKSTGRDFEKLMWQQGKFYFNEDGTPALDSPEAVKTLTFIQKFVKEGLTENTEEWTQPWYDGMNNGNVATIIGAAWMGGFLKGWISPDTKGKWGIVPLPVWPGSEVRTANDGGSNMVISNSSQNKEAAWAFVEFMLGRKDSQITMFKTNDAFPSLEETYSDPIFNEPDEYFAGQEVRKIYAESSKQVPKVTYTKNYAQAHESFITAYTRCILKGEDPEKVLKEANEEVKSKIE